MKTIDPADVIVELRHPHGRARTTLAEWIRTGPPPGRPGVAPEKAFHRVTGRALPLTVVPLSYRNDYVSRRMIATGDLAPPWPGIDPMPRTVDPARETDDDLPRPDLTALPNFRQVMRSRMAGAGQGMVVAAFLASLADVSGSPDPAAIDRASRALETTVIACAPAGATTGWLSRVGYAIFVPGADREQAEQIAETIRYEAPRRERELDVAAAVGVAMVGEFDAALDRAVRDADNDSIIRYGFVGWRYRLRVFDA